MKKSNYATGDTHACETRGRKTERNPVKSGRKDRLKELQ